MKDRVVRHLHIVLTAVLLTGATHVPPVAAQDAANVFAAFEQSVVDVVRRAEYSIVAVARIPLRNERIDRQPARRPFGMPHDFDGKDPLQPGFVPDEFGAGILLSQPGKPETRFILTNYHVVRGGRPFVNDGSVVSEARLAVRADQASVGWASIYAADPRSDLAVLAVEEESELATSLKDRPVLPLPSSAEFRKGQFVLALGNPYAIARDGSPSVSFGMISNVSRLPLLNTTSQEKLIHEFGTLLHVDTRLEPGSSGGALLNTSGELIGITTSLAALEGYESSAGYAIPFNTAMRRIVDDLLNGYEVEYGFLGVQADAPQRQRFNNFQIRSSQGIQIFRVVPDSPADRGGLRTGELIRAVNGVRLYSQNDLFREVGLLSPGTKAHLHVISREGQRFVDVELGKWPVLDPDRIIVSQHRQEAWRGLRVDWPSGRMKHFDQEAPYPTAVVVKTVDAGSPADAAGLRPGDLIERIANRPVETPTEFAAAVKTLRGSVRLDLSEGRVVMLDQ